MMAPEEVAARLKTAADVEIGSINYLERFGAKADELTDMARLPSEIRRQAEALGEAHRIMVVLTKRPDLAALIRAEVAS